MRWAENIEKKNLSGVTLADQGPEPQILPDKTTEWEKVEVEERMLVSQQSVRLFSFHFYQIFDHDHFFTLFLFPPLSDFE